MPHAARNKFTKLVYDSKFTKRAKGMSFANSSWAPELQRGVAGSSARHQEGKHFHGLVKHTNLRLGHEAQRPVTKPRVRQAGWQRRRGLWS